jgi:flagellar biosynthesis regulator FlbT
VPKHLLTLDPGEKGVVGTMVVENVQDGPIQLAVEGDGPVLRGKMIITHADATTPALQVYHMTMTMYLEPERFMTLADDFLELSRQIIESVPSMGLIMADIGEAVRDGRYKDAHEASLQLLEYEDFLAKSVAGDG